MNSETVKKSTLPSDSYAYGNYWAIIVHTHY